MPDIFDFVLGSFLHDVVYEAIKYEKEEHLMRDYEEFKESIYSFLNDLSDSKIVTNGEELMSFASELHDILEGVIQDWADDNNILDDYIDWI